MEVQAQSIMRRIWRYRFHYIIAFPGLLLIFIFKIVPFLSALRLPFIHYNLFRGLADSPWAGWDNFRTLFSNPAFRTVFANTLALKLTYMLVCGILAVALALALGGIVSRWLRYGLATLFLIPYFIPSAVAAYLVQHAFSAGNMARLGISASPLLDKSLFPLLLVMMEAVKTCGIPALLALAAMEAKSAVSMPGADMVHHRLIPAARVAVAFVLLQLSTLLATDFELLHSLLNPLVMETGDTLATFQYRTSMLQANYSPSSALWLLQFALQFMFTVAAYLLVRRFFKEDLFTGLKEKQDMLPPGGKTNIAGLLVALLYAVFLLGALYGLFIYPFTVTSSANLSVWDITGKLLMLQYGLIYWVVVNICLLITVTLAYPLTVKDLPGRGLYKGLLLMVMVMGTGVVHEYLFFKNAGMVNTIFPAAISGFFSISSIFVLKSIFNSRFSKLKDEAAAAGKGELHSFFCLFIPKLWKPLIGLGAVHFAVLWGSYYPSLLYINNPNLMPPLLRFRTAAMAVKTDVIAVGSAAQALNGDTVILLQAGAVIALLPVVLLLVFRRFLTPEVLISQLRK